MKLYRLTGERRYLDLAKFFIDERGRQPHYFDQEAIARAARIRRRNTYGTYEYSQSHVPVREQRQSSVTRCARCISTARWRTSPESSATPSLMAACKTLWADLTTKRLYVTGGLGPSARNEGFTADYDLPNETAYAETCAAVGLIFWAHRMLLVERDARYADMMELALYNGALSGLSLDGEQFFYDNPLASRGEHRRWTWHRCPCCPPNIGRLIASLGQYVYSTGAGEAAVHLYIAGPRAARGRRRERHVAPDDAVSLGRRDRDRGRSGARVDFALRLRVPAGAAPRGCRSTARRSTSAPLMDRGYAHIRRRWQKGDEVALVLDMPAERIYAHPEVAADVGRVALKRGPIVYCLEGTDNDAPCASHRVAAVQCRRGAVRTAICCPASACLSAEARGGSTVGGRRALPHRSAEHGADDDPRHSVQLLEQPRVRRK